MFYRSMGALFVFKYATPNTTRSSTVLLPLHTESTTKMKGWVAIFPNATSNIPATFKHETIKIGISMGDGGTK